MFSVVHPSVVTSSTVQKLSKYPGIQYSVDIKDIGKFEPQNNISVNVYGYEDKKKSSHYVLPS